MRVLVTGAAGFIGSEVRLELLDGGHEVVALDCLLAAAHGQNPNRPPDLVVADVRDRDAVQSALRGVDVVVHQAAMVGMGVDTNDLPEYVSCNDYGTSVLLAAMTEANAHRLVLASSMVVYGEGAYTCAVARRDPARATVPVRISHAGRSNPTLPATARDGLNPALVTEETRRCDPRNVYAATKPHQEHLCAAYWARETRQSTAIALRYHNVYGPGMPATPRMPASPPSSGRPWPGASHPGCSRMAVNVETSSTCTTSPGPTSPPSAHPTECQAGLTAYNIASGHPRTVGDVAAALSAVHRGPQPVVTGQFRAGDVRHITASSTRAREQLGFTASTSFLMPVCAQNSPPHPCAAEGRWRAGRTRDRREVARGHVGQILGELLADPFGVGVVERVEYGQGVTPYLGVGVGIAGCELGVAEPVEGRRLVVAVTQLAPVLDRALVAGHCLAVPVQAVVGVAEAVPGRRLAVAVADLLLERQAPPGTRRWPARGRRVVRGTNRRSSGVRLTGPVAREPEQVERLPGVPQRGTMVATLFEDRA